MSGMSRIPETNAETYNVLDVRPQTTAPSVKASLQATSVIAMSGRVRRRVPSGLYPAQQSEAMFLRFESWMPSHIRSLAGSARAADLGHDFGGAAYATSDERAVAVRSDARQYLQSTSWMSYLIRRPIQKKDAVMWATCRHAWFNRSAQRRKSDDSGLLQQNYATQDLPGLEVAKPPLVRTPATPPAGREIG